MTLQIDDQTMLWWRLAKARQCDMRNEPSALGRNTGLDNATVDSSLEPLQIFVRRNPDPKLSYTATRRELANAGKLQVEGRQRDTCQRLPDVIERIVVDLTDEAEGQMQVVEVGPAGVGEAMGETIQRIRHFLRHCNGDEQSRQSASRSLVRSAVPA